VTAFAGYAAPTTVTGPTRESHWRLCLLSFHQNAPISRGAPTTLATLQGRNHWGSRRGVRTPQIWTDHPNFFDKECDYHYVAASSARNCVYHLYFVLYSNLDQGIGPPTLKTWVRRCNIVADREFSTNCYIFTVSNSALLFYTKHVSTTPSQPRPLPSPTTIVILITVMILGHLLIFSCTCT